MKKSPFRLLAALLGVLSSAMIFLDVITWPFLDLTLTGVEAVFGTSIEDEAVFEIEFNIIALIAFALPFIAALSLLLSRRAGIFATICFGAAAVLLVLLPEYMEVRIITVPTDLDWARETGLVLAVAFAAGGFLLSLFETTQGK